MEMLKKISTKTVCGAIKDVTKPRELFALIGIATDVVTGTSNFGDWIAFDGNFEAVKLETGEVFRAPRAFLPEPAQGMLRAALRDNENVEIGIIVGVKPHDGPMGYEYTMKPLHESRSVDPLEHIRDAVKTKVPQLAGPVESGETPAKKK